MLPIEDMSGTGGYIGGIGGFDLFGLGRKLTLIDLKQDLILAYLRYDDEKIKNLENAITTLLENEVKEMQDRIDHFQNSPLEELDRKLRACPRVRPK